MIICPKCQYDNDLGRIFCAKCGEKLDISRVRAPSSVRRRAKSGRNMSFQKMFSIALKKMFKVAILAAVCSIVSMLLLSPKVQRKDFSVSSLESFQAKRAKLDDASSTEQQLKFTFTEGEINSAIAQAISNSNKAEAANPNLIKLESMYFALEDGAAVVTFHNKWRWFRLSLQERVTPLQVNDNWTFQLSTFWIGRLRLPPVINKFVDDQYFSKIWTGFVAEKGIIEHLGSLEIKPGEAHLTTK